MMDNSTDDNVYIVYDDECPVCRMYCRGLKTEVNDENLKLIDARKESDLMNDITSRGLDIDEGMVLKVGDNVFYGSNAIHEISKLHKPTGFYGWMNAIFFRPRMMAFIFYPIGKFFRNVLLRLLGVAKINNLKE